MASQKKQLSEILAGVTSVTAELNEFAAGKNRDIRLVRMAVRSTVAEFKESMAHVWGVFAATCKKIVSAIGQDIKTVWIVKADGRKRIAGLKTEAEKAERIAKRFAKLTA